MCGHFFLVETLPGLTRGLTKFIIIELCRSHTINNDQFTMEVIKNLSYSIHWNPDFSNPWFLNLQITWNQTSFPFPQSNAVILLLISQTVHFFKPILVSLGDSRNWDSTMILFCFVSHAKTWNADVTARNKAH